MDPERWRRISRLYHEARTRSADDRVVYLDSACGDDAALRRELDALLADETRAATLLAMPSVETATFMAPHVETVRPSGMGTPSIASALAHRYTIHRELGRGGMATVYLADDPKHKRQVAIKVLHSELAAAIGSTRFVREIEIAAKLSHPHIIPVFDSGETEGWLYYVMPVVEGESLRARLARENRLPVLAAIRIIEQVASALTYAHQHGIVHRDIKPENILLAGDQAVVADFGIARAVQARGSENLTAVGIVIGTPAYISPEQAFGQANVDGRADIYAMGCVLFEMIAGRLPFEASSLQGLLSRHAVDTAPSLRAIDSEVPLFVDRAVSRAMAKEPGQRFDTPNEFADTLRAEIVVAPVGRRRVAVLPPVNATNDPEHQFLVLGLHESLISQLGQGDVAVLARTSVLQYQQTEKPARDICRELALDALVESSLIRAGDSVAIHARLVDGNTGEGIWSGSYEGDLRDVLSLYRRLSGSIAAKVHGTLRPGGRPIGPRAAVDPAAYENYMRGRVHQQNFTPHDLDRALKYYQAALEIQPDYAAAYAGIALIWGSKIVLGMVPALEAGPRYRESAQRAVELDPGLAEAHQALAQVDFAFDFDWERSEASFKRAIDLDPNEPQTRFFYSHLLAALGRANESDAQIRRAVEIDPLNPFTQMLYGIQLGLTGRYEQALAQLTDIPANPLGSAGLTFVCLQLGRMSEGLRHYVRYFELLGDEEMVSALQDAGGGPQSAMIRGAETLVERSRRRFVKPNNIVNMFCWGGDLDRTMAWLERSYEMHDHEIAYSASLAWASAPLRRDPRFHEFLRKLNLPLPHGA